MSATSTDAIRPSSSGLLTQLGALRSLAPALVTCTGSIYQQIGYAVSVPAEEGLRRLSALHALAVDVEPPAKWNLSLGEFDAESGLLAYSNLDVSLLADLPIDGTSFPAPERHLTKPEVRRETQMTGRGHP